MKHPVATVLAALAVLVAVIGLSVGVYQGGWWLQENSVNRNAKINNHSYNRQSGLEAAVLQQMVDYSGLPDGDQKTVIRNKICIEIAQMQNPNPTITAFNAKECP